MICSPPAASTWTLPSTSAATSEFVVPRSIPTITSAIRPSRRRGIAGDLDLGKTEHPAIGRVARAEHLEHGPRWRRGGGRHLHRPHHPRVERLAQAGDLVDVEPPQRVVEPVEREPVALDQRRQHGTLPEAGPEPAKPAEPAAGLLEPAREAITRLQQLGHQLEPRLAPGLGELSRDGLRTADTLGEVLKRGAELGVQAIGGPA